MKFIIMRNKVLLKRDNLWQIALLITGGLLLASLINPYIFFMGEVLLLLIFETFSTISTFDIINVLPISKREIINKEYLGHSVFTIAFLVMITICDLLMIVSGARTLHDLTKDIVGFYFLTSIFSILILPFIFHKKDKNFNIFIGILDAITAVFIGCYICITLTYSVLLCSGLSDFLSRLGANPCFAIEFFIEDFCKNHDLNINVFNNISEKTTLQLISSSIIPANTFFLIILVIVLLNVLSWLFTVKKYRN